MSVRFRLLTEADVRSVLTMEDLIETMTSALERFSHGRVVQPVRTVIPVQEDALLGVMPAFVRARASAETNAADAAAPPDTALGAKLVTVFNGNHARGLDSHLASILLMDPATGALLALMDGRYTADAAAVRASVM